VLEAAEEAMSSSAERTREPLRRLAAASAARALESRRLADSIETGEDERLQLLRDSLVTASRRDAVTAIRAVALLRNTGVISVALENLSEADDAQRANALEVIETIGDRELIRPLLALWEPERSHHLEAEWRERALHHPDDWIRACAAWAAGATAEEARDGGAEDEAAKDEAAKDEVAKDEGEGDRMTETLATLPVMDRVLFLRRVPLFADLPPQDLLPIAVIASEHSFADADTIAQQDEPGDEMHIIVSGYVMVILRQQDGHQQVLAVRSAGDVIGEMAVITSGPRMASLAAKGPVRLLSIARRQFEAMLRERPETSLALMRVLCQRLADRDASVPE
jgi:CRP/FNR family transcriptional regulator, cyclic AMP receptor protein